MFTINLLRAALSKSIRVKPFRVFLFYTQIFIMCMAAGSATWHSVSVIKSVFGADNSPDFNAWTTMFFNPVEAPLINYLASSLIMLISFSYFYSKLQANSYSLISFICRRLSFHNKFIMLMVALLIALFDMRSSDSLNMQAAASIGLLLLSFLNYKHFFLIPRTLLILSIITLFGLMGFEAFSLIIGPVQVLNEYLPLPSTPMIKGVTINIGDLGDTIEPSIIKELTLNTSREYFYQLANRGVFNHIGHVLNPVNEYLNGKPPSEIYFQYGLGFSFVYKWTMELFGGFAVQNYFKCHIYFILYWIIYFFISIYLFRSGLFVLFSMLALAISFFSLGYDGFLIAPGINPLIHFFDLPLLFFLFSYFNSRKANDLILAFCTGVVGVFLNQQFGLFGMLAAAITLAMFYLENYSGVKRMQLCTLLPVAVILPLAVSRFLLPAPADSVFGYFLKGYFSFPPDPKFVVVILANAALSYAFLLWKKNDKTPLKYLFVFLFLYFQALLVYYYWSGLTSHFWPIFPIMVLQLLVMIQMMGPVTFIRSKPVKTILTTVALALFILMTVDAAKFYYKQKRSYSKVFKNNKVYSWDFDRARIVSTIDPEPMSDSVDLLRQYSGASSEGKGVFIISVFDNILPMLAERYSLMPFFEMQWFLITRKEVNHAISRINKFKPEYIFVGHEVEAEQLFDPWLVIFDESVNKGERTSASGRLQELRKIFLSIKSDYTPVTKGKLLTVYKLN